MATPRELAAARRAGVVAAAGFGKTELIASAVGHAKGVQLVLTHTHAGVDAIRRRMDKLSIPRCKYKISTIAGFCLRYASAYPSTSGLRVSKPLTSEEWQETYVAGVRLLESSAVEEVVRASYGGVFVDEYQDCTTDQHALVLQLAQLLPCRVLGDPLQGIFAFGGDLVDWDCHVEGSFDMLDEPQTPWRWHANGSNSALGDWLRDVRKSLLNGQALDMTGLPDGVVWREATSQSRIATLVSVGNRDDTVVGMFSVSNRTHALAKKLPRRMFRVVEALGCADLMKAARDLEKATGPARIAVLFAFAKKCMTGMGQFDNVVAAASDGGRHRLRTRLDQFHALQAARGNDALAHAATALGSLADGDGVKLYRFELLKALVLAIRHNEANPGMSLEESAWMIRDRVRRTGRRLPRRCLARPVLVKGLEFDHAVILDADTLDAKNLYVAMTRGSKSLTLLSSSRTIVPR